MQLVSKEIRLFDPMKSKVIGEKEVHEKFGVKPEQVIDVQSLAGDSSANIIGARGIGLQTGAKLLAQYGNLDALFNSIDELDGAHGKYLRKSEKNVRLARRLLALCTDVVIGNNLKEFRYLV